ncbi:hypothetical protein B0H19DRAFT_1057119 [Mycena capillaripes]|nr:hypothetical protein B0H19DRAFT_1057119 [Mycena capillaripes]
MPGYANWAVIPAEFLMDRAPTYRAFTFVILTLHRHESTEDAVDKVGGLRRILAAYWAEIIHKVATDIEDVHILRFLLDEDNTDVERWAEIVEGIDGSEAHLAHLLVQQLTRTAACPISNSTTMRNSSLTPGMLVYGGTKAVIDAIFLAEEAPYIIELAGEKVYEGLIFLLVNFESDAGAAWVSQALSARLLKLVVTLGARRIESEEIWVTYSLLQRFLKKILPEYLRFERDSTPFNVFNVERGTHAPHVVAARKPAVLDAALVKPLYALAANGTQPIQEIYYLDLSCTLFLYAPNFDSD